MATYTKRRVNFAITMKKTAFRSHNLHQTSHEATWIKYMSFFSLRSAVHGSVQRKYHIFEGDHTLSSMPSMFHPLAGCYGVIHQILTRICALRTSASCLRASISFWPWLWVCCCIFALIFCSNLRRKLQGKWPQSSVNACCRSHSEDTPLIQHCSKPRNRINW